MSKAADAGVFDGVRILSLAEQLPGPFATMLLADLGADVILVERPTGGDPARAFPPLFTSMARNNRSLELDLKTNSGRARFEVLAHTADVVVEGFRPGVMDRLGLGYPALAQLNPRLVYASISGFGQTGPYRDRTAHDLSYQGIAGHLSGGTPFVPYGDLAGAMFAAFSIASALFARERTGHGTSWVIVKSGERGWNEAGIPWSPVHELAAAAADPHFRERGLFGRLGPDEDGPLFTRQPIRFSHYATGIRRGAPSLGQHTREILDTEMPGIQTAQD